MRRFVEPRWRAALVLRLGGAGRTRRRGVDVVSTPHQKQHGSVVVAREVAYPAGGSRQ